MTEESDSDDVIRQHKLTWRSESEISSGSFIITIICYSSLPALSCLIKKLDKCHAQQQKHGQFKFKTRDISTPSELTPSPGYPSWAVQDVEHSSVNTSVCSEE